MSPRETPGRTPDGAGPGPCRADLSTVCMSCGASMRPEHAHYRCPACGWRDSCCDGVY